MPSVEAIRLPGRRLGLRPTDPDRPVLRMGAYLTGAVPAHPASVDYFARVPKWSLGRNDRVGSCGPTAAANLALLVSTWLAPQPVMFTDDEILDLYARSCPGFNPATGDGDNGVDMTVMLAELVRNGVGAGPRNVKALAFAALDTTNVEEVMAAGALFGGVLWGADLDRAQQAQTEAHPPVWDYLKGSPEWGGHAIMAAGTYRDDANDLLDRTRLISWATPIDATDAFVIGQVQECYAVIWPWHLGSGSFLAGVDLAALAADYTAMTGRPFPAPVSPKPAPTPTPTPAPAPAPAHSAPSADARALARDIRAMLTARGL